jgi:Universal stress protein UspA and related nucleotide-binding proteins
MKIILATDFSDESKTLTHYAFDLLKDTGGTILLFHAYMDHLFVSDSSFPGNYDTENVVNIEMYAELEKIAQKQMDQSISWLNNEITNKGITNIYVIPKLIGGDPELQLLTLIDEEKADLVLMGTRGKGHKGFLEGSLSKSLMSKSPIPLLSVHEEYKHQQNREVLYATNFGQFEITTLTRILEILKPFKPNIHVIHFVVDQNPQKSAALLKELEHAFECRKIEGTITFQLVYTTNPKEALKSYCEEHHITLASFIPYRRNILDLFFRDKVTKEDFYDLHIPLLTLNEP